jgi:cell division septation protein DedD
MAKTKTGATRKRRPYLQLTRRGTYGSLLLIVAACAWMFFVGVLVGRGTAPIHFDMEALSRELQALKQTSEERRRQQLESYADAIEEQSTLDVYAELKRADDEPTIDPSLNRQIPTPSIPTETSVPAASPDQPAIPVIRRQAGLQPKKSGRVAPAVRPAGGAEANRTPEVSTAAKATQAVQGQLTVQVAALKDAREAGAMVARLRRQGFDAYQSKAALPGKGTWYRVRIGRYPDREAAAGIMRRLEGQGVTPIVVVY